MEPMTLGSPTHSPSGSPNVGYLPPFLLGELNPPTTPRTNSLSPTKSRNLAFGKITCLKKPTSFDKALEVLHALFYFVIPYLQAPQQVLKPRHQTKKDTVKVCRCISKHYTTNKIFTPAYLLHQTYLTLASLVDLP